MAGAVSDVKCVSEAMDGGATRLESWTESGRGAVDSLYRHRSGHISTMICNDKGELF